MNERAPLAAIEGLGRRRGGEVALRADVRFYAARIEDDDVALGGVSGAASLGFSF